MTAALEGRGERYGLAEDRDDLPGHFGLLVPGGGQLAGAGDGFLFPGAVVAAAADAVAFRAPGVVALGVAPAGKAVAGVDGDEGGHRYPPPALRVRAAGLLVGCIAVRVLSDGGQDWQGPGCLGRQGPAPCRVRVKVSAPDRKNREKWCAAG